LCHDSTAISFQYTTKPNKARKEKKLKGNIMRSTNGTNQGSPYSEANGTKEKKRRKYQSFLSHPQDRYPST
jgi:hypothetical protein